MKKYFFSAAVRCALSVLILSILSVGFTYAQVRRSVGDVKANLAPAAAFTSGNLAVLQAASATANNTTASVVEINAAAGGAVQTIAIDGATFRFGGSATSTGYLANSNDGSLISFNAANSATSAGNSNAILTRGVGSLDSTGAVSVAATYTGVSGNQPRSATSVNNLNWFIGDQGGLYTNGTTAASPSGNFRAVKSFGGVVYVGTASGSPSVQVSTLPAPSGGTVTPLTGLATNSTHQDFYLISSGENGATYDVLYVLSASGNTAGSITKFSNVSGTWTANGSYTTTFGGFGIAAADSGTGALIYVSTGQGALAANSVLKLNDTTGYNAAINISAAPTTLYTAPPGTTVKGVAFAPVNAGPTAPEIDVQAGGISIADGDTTPSTADHTDVGSATTGGSFIDQPYVIRNPGTANLTGSTPTITGANAGDFTIQSAPTFPVMPGGSTSFTLRFTPSAAGVRTATINITNSDADENPYDFAVQGSGLTSATPTIIENTAGQEVINLPASGPAILSGVVGDGSDPIQTSGIYFDFTDADTPAASLIFTATSSNQAVVPNANLIIGNLTTNGSIGTRNVRVLPAGTGYTTLTFTISDGQSSSSYVISYAASTSATANQTIWHTGKADASTAILTGSNYMFIADDEDQTIRLYNRSASGLPVASFNFTPNLALTDFDGAAPREVDIEASAQIGNRIYWLASHSNSSSGNSRPNRSRLFATDISGTGAASTLTYVGRFDNLKANMIAWDNANGHGLGAGFFGLQASATAGVIPEDPSGGGFNIEGLTIAPDGSTAYVAFRAPISPATARTKALIIPVTNFASLVTGNPTATTATFGTPIQLNLGGRGIREIKKNAANEYLILAGTAGGASDFALYSWTGFAVDAPVLRYGNLNGLNPESIVDVPVGLNARAPVQVQLISDNGDDIYYGDGVIAKELPNDQFKKFRSDIVNVGLSPTAATVSVSGRILNPAGTGVSKALVTLTDSSGSSRIILTNQTGYYEFEDIAAGTTYIVNISAKGFSYSPAVLTVNEEMLDLNFTVNP